MGTKALSKGRDTWDFRMVVVEKHPLHVFIQIDDYIVVYGDAW